MKDVKEKMAYIFFGICTTVINVISYVVLKRIFNLEISLSTIMAWIIAVVFAFLSNRKYVFQSKAIGGKANIKEFARFIYCRVLTGILDLGLMLVGVSVLRCDEIIVKMFANVVVIILNYVASKKIVFKTEKNIK